MNLPTYYTLTFMVRKAQKMRSGEVPIFARITISGQRMEFNINRSIEPAHWNATKGMSKGRSKKDVELNKYLDSIRVRMSEIHARLLQDEEAINPLVLKQHFLGNIEGPKMLCAVFRDVIDQYRDKLDRGDICKSTFLRWERCEKYLSEFLSYWEGVTDIPIKKLKSGMIDDFEHFLRVNKDNGNNAAVKYIRYLKKVTRVAIANKWLSEDPFINKRYTRTVANREALTEKEIKSIMALNLTSLPRLDQVRDIFIFCCFTGLAFVDISTLTRDQIIEDEHGWQTAKSQTDISERQVETLNEAVRKTQLIMRHSDTTYLEVLTALQTLLDAEMILAQRRFDRIQAVINLYHALGGGTD